MRSEKKLLPSISMLAAFDATARIGSVSGAARELNLTHGAVSRQVAALEFQLGASLLVRSARGVSLTDVGKAYALEIRAALSALRSASLNVITSPLSCTMNLAILPTFGTRWLMPRFPSFLREHPDITVNFVTRLSQFEFGAEGIDTAIHYGTPDWPGAECTFLMGEKAIPVCAPALWSERRNMAAEDLHKLPLLHLESRADAWKDWFDIHGLDAPRNTGTMVFEQFSTVAHAAVAGLGAALLPRFLIRGELERGELVVLSNQAVVSEMRYYLVTPEAKTEYAPVVALREWLLATIERENSDLDDPLAV
ncbi:MAG: LysR family transcriptional regulator [Proteobacteria bacterium]|nr:LysR family transcriptional regulator [Pseudomonadota bacterium]